MNIINMMNDIDNNSIQNINKKKNAPKNHYILFIYGGRWGRGGKQLWFNIAV